ncbi:hypothetical protein MY4038_004845 [Beauveria bassiana]
MVCRLSKYPGRGGQQNPDPIGPGRMFLARAAELSQLYGTIPKLWDRRCKPQWASGW